MAKFSEAVNRGVIENSEADRLRWVSTAERALEVGDDPPAVFASIVRDVRWDFISADQEQRAHQRLKRWMHGPDHPRESERQAPGSGTPPAPEQTLSPDARFAAMVMARAVTRGRYRSMSTEQAAEEIWPQIQQRKPDWTWDRWIGAVREWEASKSKEGAA